MKKKYNVNVIMDIPQSVLYDFDYIPKYYFKSKNERVIAYLNTIIDKKIDINILGINNQDKVRYNKISLLLKPDMEIHIDMRGKFIKIKTDDVNVYKKDFDLYINTNINRLADYIVNKFSKINKKT